MSSPSLGLIFLAMLKTYYDLLDRTKLPPKSYVIDPYDNTKIIVEKTDSLDTIQSKFAKHRQSINAPTIVPIELTHYIIASLYETTQEPQRPKFFAKKTAL